MANEVKGEFELKALGATWKLVLDANALCEAEGMLGENTGQWFNRLGKGDMRLLRTLIWVAMRRFHPEESVEMAGDILTDLTPTRITAELLKALAKTFPPPKPNTGAAEGGSRPPARATAKA